MLVALFYVTCFIFVIVVLGLILKMVDFSIFKLIRYLREELLTSKGAHGVPGSAIVILAVTLISAVPAIPAIGLVLVLSVD